MKNASTRRRTCCPFCKLPESKPTGITIYEKSGFGKLSDATIVECVACAGQYADVVPCDAGFIEIYAKKYAHQFGGLDRFEKNYPGISFALERVLEVGGGDGGIAKLCKEYHSVEIRGGSLHNGMFDTLGNDALAHIRSMEFDAIVSCDCIEHVLYPAEFFKNAAAILEPGRLMYVQFGDMNRNQGLVKRQAAHINAPSVRSIEIMSHDDWRVTRGSEKNTGWIFVRE